MNIMRIRILHIAAIAALSALCSCQKETPEQSSNVVFDVNVEEEGTKSLLRYNNFKTSGNELHVYDQLSFSENVSAWYINDTLRANGSAWVLDDEYPWTRNGTHRFFAWLCKDNTVNPALSPETLFGSKFVFDSNNSKIEIAATEMTVTGPQFDFLYSEPVVRPMGAGSNHDAVPLNMKHLFSAISVGAQNTMEESDVTVTEVKILGLKNRKSATIKFDGTTPQVTYANAAHTENFVSTHSGVTIQHNIERNKRMRDIMTGVDATKPILVWPQTASELTCQDPVTIDEDRTPHYNVNDPVLVIKYKLDDDPTVYEVPASLISAFNDDDHTVTEMQAGVHYHIDALFAEKMLRLKLTVLPWDYEEVDMDYSSGTVTIADNCRLQFNETVSNVNGHNVGIKQGMAAVGSFRLMTPLGATVLVSLSGDFDRFTTEVTQGEVVDGETFTMFRVAPNQESTSTPYSVQVHIKLRMVSGRFVDADPVVQPTMFTITQSAS